MANGHYSADSAPLLRSPFLSASCARVHVFGCKRASLSDAIMCVRMSAAAASFTPLFIG